MSNEFPSMKTGHMLEGARYEVLPTAKIVDQVLAHVPTDVTVTVTASPVKSLQDTLDVASRLAGAGYDAVPHLAARMVSGPAELKDIVERLQESGIRKVFVPGGDAPEPAGDYLCAHDLLVDLRELGDPFEHVGIAGYPESHPTIDDDIIIQAMWDKRKYATHVVSNMTFDAEQLGVWLERIRRRGVRLPAIVGVAGPVERAKLLGMATKIGVGESVRFLRKQKNVFARIAAPGFYSDRFVTRVAALGTNEALAIEGLHIYTFNQVEVVETWRRRLLEQLASEVR